jgi:RNA polymerase sigma-70 factor, ECF subfamily
MSCDYDGDDLANIDGLYSYALALTRSYAAAEDLVQETYVRAMRALSRLRPGSNLRAWLFSIMRNVWLNQLRKRARDPCFIRIEACDGRLADGVAGTSTDAHDIYVRQIEARRVQGAILRLPVSLQEVVWLRAYKDLSYREIAGALDCPAGTVMSRLARARTKLRILLAEPPPPRAGVLYLKEP